MDLILGPFADAQIGGLTDAELADYERLLEAPDWDLFHWITGEKKVLEAYDTGVFRRIVAGRRG